MATNNPPDGFTVESGTWGTDIDQDTSTLFAGGSSVKMTGSGEVTLRSEPIPINAQASYMCSAVVRASSVAAGKDFTFRARRVNFSTGAQISAGDLVSAAPLDAAAQWIEYADTMPNPGAGGATGLTVEVTKAASSFDLWIAEIRVSEITHPMKNHLSSAQSISASTLTVIDFDNIATDFSEQNWTNSSGTFTCVRPGYYFCSAGAQMPINNGSRLFLGVYKGGNAFCSANVPNSTGGSFDIIANCSGVQRFDYGDTLSARVFHANALSTNLSATLSATGLHVVRVA